MAMQAFEAPTGDPDVESRTKAVLFVSDGENHIAELEQILDESELNKIKDWGENNLSTNIKQDFLKTLVGLYKEFRLKLNSDGQGTKGMCYSEAVASLEHYKQANSESKFFFIGTCGSFSNSN